MWGLILRCQDIELIINRSIGLMDMYLDYNEWGNMLQSFLKIKDINHGWTNRQSALWSRCSYCLNNKPTEKNIFIIYAHRPEESAP